MHGPSHRIEPKDRRIREGSTRLNQGVRPSRPTGPLSDVLALQRVLGNRAVSRLIENGLRAEDELVSAARPVVEGEGGWPLDFATRREMESKLGHDLGDVRLDTGAEAARSARELHGEANVIGRDVILGAGAPSLETSSGRAVLAHELVHVLQWRSSPIPSQIIAPSAHPSEAEAHRADPPNQGVRRAVEEQLGTDLSDVRVHTGPQADERARAERAVALTSGRDVYLRRELDLTGDLGQRIIAHELTHVVQQKRGEAGMPLTSEPGLEREASAISGVGAARGPIEVTAAAPGSVQKIGEEEIPEWWRLQTKQAREWREEYLAREAELQEEWRRLHPQKEKVFRTANPFDIGGSPAERAAYQAWCQERLRQLRAESAAKARPGTEADEARKRIAATKPPTRDLAAEAKAWKEAHTPPQKFEAAKRPPLRPYIGKHERKLLEASTMFDILPGGKLGRNIMEFFEGEDIIGRKLSRRKVSGEILKEVLLQIPLLIPEGGSIGKGGGAEALVERELGESSPILEELEAGGRGGLGRETVLDVPPGGAELAPAPAETKAGVPLDLSEEDVELAFAGLGKEPQELGVRAPVKRSGEPAKVMDVGAGPGKTNLGGPPEPELVTVTRSNVTSAGNPDVLLDYTKSVPREMRGQYTTVILNNPHGETPDINHLKAALVPGGKIILQGNWKANKYFRNVSPIRIPPGTSKTVKIGDMKVTVERDVPILGRGFRYTDPDRPGAPRPNSRITFEFD